MLLSQDDANQATHGWSVREDAHDIGVTSDLLVETFQRVVGPDLLPVGDREAGEGQDIGASIVQKRGNLREPVLELIGQPIELGVYLIGGGLLVDRRTMVATHG